MTESSIADRVTHEEHARAAVTQLEIDQRVFDLYDEYCHGRIDRREFLQRAGVLTVGGVSALAMAQALLPRYAQAQTISFTDPRIKAQYVSYPSPGGNSGTMRGYLVRPSGPGPFAGVLVIHENRGLNPYIEDVARRAAAEGFLALAPDGLSPAGGYPGNDDDGRALQAESRPGEAAHRHGQQRALPEGARPVQRQAWRHGLLLGRQYHELPGDHPRLRSAGGSAVLRCRRRDDGRAQDQGAPAHSLRGERRAHQRAVAGLRGCAEVERRLPTRCTCIRGPSTAFTTIRRRATTKWRPSWPGSERSCSSRRIWPEGDFRDDEGPVTDLTRAVLAHIDRRELVDLAGSSHPYPELQDGRDAGSALSRGVFPPARLRRRPAGDRARAISDDCHPAWHGRRRQPHAQRPHRHQRAHPALAA